MQEWNEKRDKFYIVAHIHQYMFQTAYLKIWGHSLCLDSTPTHLKALIVVDLCRLHSRKCFRFRLLHLQNRERSREATPGYVLLVVLSI